MRAQSDAFYTLCLSLTDFVNLYTYETGWIRFVYTMPQLRVKACMLHVTDMSVAYIELFNCHRFKQFGNFSSARYVA